MPTPIDYLVEDHGTIIIVQPLSAKARRWLEVEEDGMWYGGGLAVDHRYAGSILLALRGEGFVGSEGGMVEA